VFRTPAACVASLPMSYHDSLLIVLLLTPTVLSNETENGRNQTVRKKCFLFTFKMTPSREEYNTVFSIVRTFNATAVGAPVVSFLIFVLNNCNFCAKLDYKNPKIVTNKLQYVRCTLVDFNNSFLVHYCRKRGSEDGCGMDLIFSRGQK